MPDVKVPHLNTNTLKLESLSYGSDNSQPSGDSDQGSVEMSEAGRMFSYLPEMGIDGLGDTDLRWDME